jgi:hypothetical protein
MAVPVYRRNRYEGNTTNHLAGPLLAAVLGAHVQQPIAGDFAFNRAFIERAVTWPLPESAQLYGIDVYLTGNAAREGHRICEVPLGRKIHNPGFPKIVKKSQQVIDALWHIFCLSGAARPSAGPLRLARSTVDDAAVRPDAGLAEQTFAMVSRYMAGNAGVIAGLFPCLAVLPWRGDSNPYRGKRCYLLGTGSCLEFGEEGFVGRGNTPAGYIPLHRPKSAEASFGKNPVYHAGKVYAVHAGQIARRIFEVTGTPATVTIASRHSDPLRQPSFTDIALHGDAAPQAVREITETSLATADHLALALDGWLVPR